MNISFIYSYSSFLFETATKEKKIKQYAKQVTFLLSIIHQTELVSFLSNLSIEKEVRKQQFKLMFNKKLDTMLIYFVWTIIDFNRSNYLEKILLSFLSIYDDYYGINFAKVYSVYPLSEKQLNKIKKALEQKYRSKVILQNEIDPSIIGGIKVESKRLSIDNTFKKKLDVIKQKCVSPIQQRS